MAVGTAYKEVRLYDVRESSNVRRPILTTPEGLLEYRVTSLCQVDEHEIVVGDTAGYIYSMDIRRMSKDLKAAANKDMGRYVGPAGSVRKLVKHPTLPRMAAVGLDRMLRVYDTKKRKQLDCVYLKQRLNCVLFHKDNTWDIGDVGSGSDADVDPDDIDIDQDDVVRDYVDSDDDDDHSRSEDEESSQADDNSSDEGIDHAEVGPENDHHDDDDDEDSAESKNSEADDESIEASDGDDADEKSDKEESNTGSDSSEEEDEVIVVKAPKRRRHR
jgi:ribosome biogenesis protein NSA1